MSIERRPQPKAEKPPSPERELSPRAKIGLVVSLLLLGGGLVREVFSADPKKPDKVLMDPKKAQDLKVDLGMVRRLLRNLNEQAEIDDAQEGVETEPITDLRQISFDRERFRQFPNQDQPDSVFSRSLIMINQDRYMTQLMDEDPELAENFQEQIDNLRFEVDETTVHVYVEGENDTDQVYELQKLYDEESGEFLAWSVYAPHAEWLQTQILSSGDEAGVDPEKLQEAIRNHYQQSLLEPYTDGFRYTVTLD